MSIKVSVLSIFLIAMGQSITHASQNLEPCQLTLDFPTQLLNENVIVFGELHGTKEAPFAFLSAICTQLKIVSDKPVSVGLEYPAIESDHLGEYIASVGDTADKKKFLSTPFWNRETQDGRTSQAMFELIESLRKLRAITSRLNVFAIVPNPGSGRHSELMAEAINAELDERPNSPHFVLVGNLHSRQTIGRPGDDEYRSMMHWINDRAISIAIASRSGNYWACTASGCGFLSLGAAEENRYGTLESAQPRIGRTENHDHVIIFDAFSASPPAIEFSEKD